MSARRAQVLDLSRVGDRTFLHLLVNVLVVSVMSFTVWFAITFWVFIETRSVLATGMVAGIFLSARRRAAPGAAACSSCWPCSG